LNRRSWKQEKANKSKCGRHACRYSNHKKMFWHITKLSYMVCVGTSRYKKKNLGGKEQLIRG